MLQFSVPSIWADQIQWHHLANVDLHPSLCAFKTPGNCTISRSRYCSNCIPVSHTCFVFALLILYFIRTTIYSIALKYSRRPQRSFLESIQTVSIGLILLFTIFIKLKLFSFGFRLKQFYYNSSNLQYFRTLIQIPRLPDVSVIYLFVCTFCQLFTFLNYF